MCARRMLAPGLQMAPFAQGSRAVLPVRIVDKDMGRLAKLETLARWLRLRSRLRCSFCGRTGDQVERLVAGPSVYICDECIKTCVAVVEQHGGFSPSRPADPRIG